MNLQKQIRRVLKEEESIRLSKKLWEILNQNFTNEFDILCNIEIFPKIKIIDGKKEESFNVTFFFKGGSRNEQDEIMNNVWMFLYDYIGTPSDLSRIMVNSCNGDIFDKSLLESSESLEKKEIILKKVNLLIDENGLYETIKMLGGYESFNELLPEYFSFKEKVRLINELTEKMGEENSNNGGSYIYFYEIPPYFDINFLSEKSEDGKTTYESYFTYVGEGEVRVNIYDFDTETGDIISDDPYDTYSIDLYDLNESSLDLIFDFLVHSFLK